MSPEIITLSDAAIYAMAIVLLLSACAFFLTSSRGLDRFVFGAIVIVMLVNYALYRVAETLPPFGLDIDSMWSYLYFVLETTVIVYTVLSIFFFFRRTDNSQAADQAAARLDEAGDFPAVDVLICTYDEDLAVLERSILTSLAIDYPNFAVWVLDDGRRKWLEDYCRKVGARYVTREDNAGAKAGNINSGLAASALETNAPFILILDADFAPQRQILRRMVGLFEDPSIGIVQSPQFYYNADPVQHNLQASHALVDDQRIFFDVLQPSKDAWGTAFCVGTSFLVRRSAIEAIGGMPQETITEDLHLTYRLLQKRFRTKWLNERLSVGLSAESLSGYITQRCRWCLGTIQGALLKDGPFLGRGYSLNERLHYFHGVLFWLCRPFLIALLIAPILYYFLGLSAIYLSPEALLLYGLPAILGSWIFHSWVSGRRSLPLFAEVSHIVTAIPVTLTLIRSISKPFGHPFKVTGKAEDRSEVKVQYALAFLFVSVIVLTFVGMVNGPLLRTYSDLDGFSIAWGIVVMIYAFVALNVCIELPRTGIDDQAFPVHLPARASMGDSVVGLPILRLSLKQLTFDTRGSQEAESWAVGRQIQVEFLDGLETAAEVVENGHNRLTVQILNVDQIRSEIIARLFADAPLNIANQAHPIKALRALGRRTFGSVADVLALNRAHHRIG